MLTARHAALSFVCAASLFAGVARGETLSDAIAFAYQTNPSLQSQRAQLRALDEGYVQAEQGLRPSASVTGQVQYSSQQVGKPSCSFLGCNDATPETTAAASQLTVTQPLYTGGRVSARVRGAEGDILSGREQLRAAEAGVLQNVIQAYVDVRRDQRSLTIADQNVAVLQRQYDETKARFDVGEVTRTDVAEAEGRLAASRAELSTAQAQLGISRANYAAVVGQNPGDLEPAPPLSLLPPTVDQAFDIAERNNPSLRAADYAEQAAAARVSEARAQRRPSISLQAQLGSNVPAAPLDLHNYNTAFTASAVLTQPLFEGGLIDSQVRQALETDNARRLDIDQARRQAMLSVAQAWNQLLAARAGVISNREQVAATEVAFDGVQQEEQVGLRTTLDVLNAQLELRNAQLALVNAERDEYFAGALVLAAMGLLEARNLTPDTALYDPKVSFNRIKHAGGTPWDPAVKALDSVGAPRLRTAPIGAEGPVATAPAADTAPLTPAKP